ncbi:unnamed protein product [Calicophoron daubneyi]|uniref:Cas1p 10 TM acyl transferase domain-containing protein n=1 Tax=Calicophoron daubneyi TaxID=300641 RepID=A0AAV2T4C7_CALDB
MNYLLQNILVKNSGLVSENEINPESKHDYDGIGAGSGDDKLIEEGTSRFEENSDDEDEVEETAQCPNLLTNANFASVRKDYLNSAFVSQIKMWTTSKSLTPCRADDRRNDADSSAEIQKNFATVLQHLTNVRLILVQQDCSDNWCQCKNRSSMARGRHLHNPEDIQTLKSLKNISFFRASRSIAYAHGLQHEKSECDDGWNSTPNTSFAYKAATLLQGRDIRKFGRLLLQETERYLTVMFRLNLVVIALCLTLDDKPHHYYYMQLATVWYTALTVIMICYPRVSLHGLQNQVASEMNESSVQFSRKAPSESITSDLGNHEQNIISADTPNRLEQSVEHITAVFERQRRQRLSLKVYFQCTDFTCVHNLNKYFCIAPILSYVALRNGLPFFRNHCSRFFVRLGCISMEIYLFHQLKFEARLIQYFPVHVAFNSAIEALILFCMCDEMHQG